MKCLDFILIILLSIICLSSMQPVNDVKLQCRKYDFNYNFNISTEKHIVIVYNSALCKRCQQKLLLFKALQHRFEVADFKDLKFIMLTTELSDSTQFADIRNKSGNVTLISLQDINNDIFVPGSVYVFDKCSRLTYELVPPFSEIQNQIVKAAVLSTWYDSICGNCEFEVDDEKFLEENYDIGQEKQSTTTQSNEFHFENAEIVDPDESYTEDEDIVVKEDDINYIVPLKVVLPVQHIHKDNASDTYVKYNYLVLTSNDSSIHDHLLNDNTETLLELQSQNNESLITEAPALEFLENTKYLTGADGSNYTAKKIDFHFNSNNSSKFRLEEVEAISNAVGIVPPSSKLSENITKQLDASTLLNTLHPWLSFRLINRYNGQ